MGRVSARPFIYTHMSCLDNVIGIRAKCTADTPDANLFFEDLTGMNLRKADSATDSRFDSGLDLVQQKINMAIKYVETRVRSFYDPKIRTYSVVDNDVLGIFRDDLREIPQAPFLKGIQLDLCETPHFKLFISRLTLFVNTTGDVDVKVYDLVTGKVLDTITVPAVAGEKVTVNIYKEYESQGNLLNLLVAYDATAIESFDTHLRSSNRNCRNCRNNFRYHNKLYASGAKIATGAEIIHKNVKNSGDTSGLSLTYSLQCSSGDQICSMKNLLAWPLLHKAGQLVLEEMENTTQLNSTVVIYADEIKELREKFEDEFEKSFTEVLENARLPENECFKCKPRIRHATRIP